MNQKDQILDDEVSFRIKRINEIYNDFEKEVNLLRERQDQIINQALKEVDEKKIRDILNKLKNK